MPLGLSLIIIGALVGLILLLVLRSPWAEGVHVTDTAARIIFVLALVAIACIVIGASILVP